MNNFLYYLAAATVVLTFASPVSALESRPAAIEVVGTPPRFIANFPHGGLVKVGAAENFGTYNIVILSGASQPVDGDQIRIFDSANKTVWLEKDGKVTRYPAKGRSKDEAASVFTIKSDGIQFRLVAASGLFVSAGDKTALGTTSDETEALLLNFQWDAAKR